MSSLNDSPSADDPGRIPIGDCVRPPLPSLIYIEYDAPRGRKVKCFADVFEAKRFYVAKDRAGKNPTIVRVAL